MSMSGGKPACERWAASLPLCLTGAAAVEQLQEHASCSGCNAQNVRRLCIVLAKPYACGIQASGRHLAEVPRRRVKF